MLPCTTFRDHANQWILEVGQGTFFKQFDDSMRLNKVQIIRKWWNRARKKYWDGPVQYHRDNKNEQGEVEFGPWLFWTRNDWYQIDRDWDEHVLNTRRSRFIAQQMGNNQSNPGGLMNRVNFIDNINNRRNDNNKENRRNDNGKRSRSRSRSRDRNSNNNNNRQPLTSLPIIPNQSDPKSASV